MPKAKVKSWCLVNFGASERYSNFPCWLTWEKNQPRVNNMNTRFRKLIFAMISGLLIGIGGTAISHAGDLGTARDPSWKSAISESLPNSETVAALSKDDIREAQLELRPL